MTSEICMMNRLAVVLAADSASTVRRWNDGHQEERYFKGANKIFQLSNAHPVGLMIFDSAEVLNVPWEIIIKSFRNELESKSFNTVKEYAEELFNYLSGEQSHLFPEDVQNKSVKSSAMGILISWVANAIDNVKVEERGGAVDTTFSDNASKVDTIPVPDFVGEELHEKVVGDIKADVFDGLKKFLDQMEIEAPESADCAAAAAISLVLKDPDRYLGTTGLVFAGYGDHQTFPSMVSYTSFGTVGGRHIYRQDENKDIDHEDPAWLSGFAQKSMTDTFTTGLSQDVYVSVMDALSQSLKKFAEEVASQSGGDLTAIRDIDQLVENAKDQVTDDVFDRAWRDHAIPMRNVLRHLPLEEMAELAETLINLQSLKEKVTKPSETVGGPIDVAIITKHEGLVWIKRKHYFNLELNPRFMHRQKSLHS